LLGELDVSSALHQEQIITFSQKMMPGRESIQGRPGAFRTADRGRECGNAAFAIPSEIGRIVLNQRAHCVNDDAVGM
jgi:hypothetical protein